MPKWTDKEPGALIIDGYFKNFIAKVMDKVLAKL
jgi:hypothetical protein